MLKVLRTKWVETKVIKEVKKVKKLMQCLSVRSWVSSWSNSSDHASDMLARQLQSRIHLLLATVNTGFTRRVATTWASIGQLFLQQVRPHFGCLEASINVCLLLDELLNLSFQFHKSGLLSIPGRLSSLTVLHLSVLVSEMEKKC